MDSKPNLRTQLAEELVPRRLLLSAAAGTVVGSVTVIVAISFAALVFTGPLADALGTGIGLVLAGASILCIWIALTSSFPAMIATPQDSTAAVVALLAMSVVASLPPGTSTKQALLVTVATVSATTILAGMFFLLLGTFRLGGLIRFIPYPVIGGFLAGTGWLLVKGSIGVMAGIPLAFDRLKDLMAPAVLIQWVPGTVLALLLLFVLRRWPNVLILPGMLFGSIVFFYLLLLATGTSVATAREMGLLLGPFPEGGLWQPIAMRALVSSNLTPLLENLGSVGSVLVIGVVALLLNASGLELSSRTDIDLDRELRAAGVGNLLAGAVGGLPGFQTLGLSALGHRMAPASRITGLVCGGLCGVTAVAGAGLLSLFPKQALGGLLLYLGLAFLMEWVWDARRALPRGDWAVVLLILVVVGTAGFLESVGVGIIAAVVLFVLSYSRINVVRHSLTSASRHSNVERSMVHRQVLQECGGRVYLLTLQGFIFFGTSNLLYQRVRYRAGDDKRPPLQLVVLDFRLVTGIDSSAVLSFVKMRQLLEGRATLVLSGMNDRVREQLGQGGFLGTGASHVMVFDDLDRALEWAEDRLLESEGVTLDRESRPIERLLERIFSDPEERVVAGGYLERVELPAGHSLLVAGQVPEALYFVESGLVSAQIEVVGGRSYRIRSMGPGSIVGEVEVYLRRAAGATMVTDQPSVVHRITLETLLRLQADAPELAASFHRYMCTVFARRHAQTRETLEALLR